ncbi:hypothetical protein [Fusobacterium sp. PH5-44]|uniref:hypothetical protein n=1 Tax=unclassified Fusobacterium TaxID=2648384 RepID=UPI003D1B0C8F
MNNIHMINKAKQFLLAYDKEKQKKLDLVILFFHFIFSLIAQFYFSEKVYLINNGRYDNLENIAFQIITFAIILYGFLFLYFAKDEWFKIAYFILWLVINFVINKIFNLFVSFVIPNAVGLNIFAVSILIFLNSVVTSIIYQKLKLKSYQEYSYKYNQYLDTTSKQDEDYEEFEIIESFDEKTD